MKKLIVALFIALTATACAARQNPGPAPAPEADIQQAHADLRVMCEKFEQIAEAQGDTRLEDQLDKICSDFDQVEGEWLAGEPYNEYRMTNLMLELVRAQQKLAYNHIDAMRNLR